MSGITYSTSTKHWEGDGLESRPICSIAKLLKVVPPTAISDARH